jgi:hypothetical protein
MVFQSFKHKLAYKLNGFFVIKSFLDKDQIDGLTTFYANLNLYAGTRVSSYGVYTNNKEHHSDSQNKEIDAFITDICRMSVDRFFKNYDIGGGIYLLKGKGNESVPMHQDWNMVDERKDLSMAIWIPLVDVDLNNGCLHVIPGSHNWFNNLRSSSIQSVFLPLNKKISNLLPVPLKKGDAVVYAHSLFHGSLPNKSEQTRPTVCLSLFSKYANQISYDRNGNEVRLIHTNEQFYKNTSHYRHDLHPATVIPFRNNYQLTEEHFWKKYNSKGVYKFIMRWALLLSK